MSHGMNKDYKDNGAGRCWHCGKTESEHQPTPGPWSHDGRGLVRGSDGELLADFEKNVDADLASAAPEMADALAGLRRYLHSLVALKAVEGPTIQQWIRLTEEALTKAGRLP